MSADNERRGVTDADIAEWEAQRNNGMVSALGEYTPEEFWLLLDDVKRLRSLDEPAGSVGGEAVAEVAPSWALVWAGSEPVAEIARRHPELRVGAKLYTHPAPPVVDVHALHRAQAAYDTHMIGNYGEGECHPAAMMSALTAALTQPRQPGEDSTIDAAMRGNGGE